MLVDLDNRAVDYHVCIVAIGGWMPETPFDQPAFVLAVLSFVSFLPVSEPSRADHARECRRDNDTARLPQTNSYSKSFRRHDFHDLEKDLLSALNGCHLGHIVAFTLFVKTEEKHHRFGRSSTSFFKSSRPNCRHVLVSSASLDSSFYSDGIGRNTAPS